MTMTAIQPVRIQRSRAKGSRLTSPNGLPVVCVTRPGRWGNPFTVGASRGMAGGVAWSSAAPLLPGEAVALFSKWLNESDAGVALAKDAKRVLRGKNLACWCKLPKPGKPDICHAAVLLTIANEEST